MRPEEIQKLLGGYATGTLTSEEQDALFAAALEDQQLFDALAREQSLRDLLRDPAARAHLLAAMEEAPAPWYRRFWRPLAVSAAAACALAIGVYVMRERPQPAKPVLIAKADLPPAPASVVPPVETQPAPPPAVAARKDTPRSAPAHAPQAPPAAPKALDAVTAETAPVAAPSPIPAATPAPTAPAEPKAASAVESSTTIGELAGGIQLRDAGEKPIPLQNAQALFYALPQGQNLVEPSPAGPPPQRAKDTTAPQRYQALMKTAAAAAQAAHLGVKWTVLRQRDGGDFVEVSPDQLRAGDSVRLRLIPNDDGFISVWDAASQLAADRVERLKVFETPVIQSYIAGQKVLTVQFARDGSPSNLVRNVSGQQQSATDTTEHATYVLNVNGSRSSPISLRIPLNFK